MQILLFDTSARNKLYPLTATKAIASLRFGIFTIKERWEKLTSLPVSILTEPYLQPLYSLIEQGHYLVIDSTVLPGQGLIQKILQLELNEGMFDENGLIAASISFREPPAFNTDFYKMVQVKKQVEKIQRLEYPFQISQWNSKFIAEDFELISKGKGSLSNYDTVHFTNSSRIFIEDGADLSFSILNATEGPIYIGKNATVMEGSLIRGPFSLGEGATLKMGSKIYGGTTVGPFCVAGGEIKNSVLSGYSNKAHDGYLGDSVIGEWCNLGAGTSNSNVKNNAGLISVWNDFHKGYIKAGSKAGVVMGDYSRTSINTSLNTGAVVGVCCNIFGAGLSLKRITDFSWGNNECRYEIDKAIKDIDNWKQMKNKTFTDREKDVVKYLFDNYKS